MPPRPRDVACRRERPGERLVTERGVPVGDVVRVCQHEVEAATSMPQPAGGIPDGEACTGDQVLGPGLLCRPAAFGPVPRRCARPVEHQVTVGLRGHRADSGVDQVPDLVVELDREPPVHAALLHATAADPLHQRLPALESEAPCQGELGVAQGHLRARRIRGRQAGPPRVVGGEQRDIGGRPTMDAPPQLLGTDAELAGRGPPAGRRGRPRWCGRGRRSGPPGRDGGTRVLLR